MNKKLSGLISIILALAMAVSCITVMNMSVLADDTGSTTYTVTPDLQIDGSSIAVSYKINDGTTEYTNKTEISLTSLGVYIVSCVSGSNTYSGILTVTESGTAPTVELSELTAVPDGADEGAYYVGFADTDGYNIYRTVSGAVSAAAAGSTIYIYPGVYPENDKVTVSAQNISFINWAETDSWTDEGFTAEGYADAGAADTTKSAVVITGDWAVTTDTSYYHYEGTQNTATVTVKGNGFKAKGITFQNSYNLTGNYMGNNTTIERAVALVTQASNIVLENCRFLSVQDTLYLKTGTHSYSASAKYVYLKDCYAEGGVDFLFGDATAYFDSCELYMSHDGYYTAANTALANIGFVFNQCTFNMASGITAYMGRSWQTLTDSTNQYMCTSSNVVLVDCTTPSGIAAARWSDMTGSDVAQRTRFYEDSSTYSSSSSYSYDRLMSDSEAACYTAANVIGYDYNSDVWSTPSEAIAVSFTNIDGTPTADADGNVTGVTEMYALDLSTDDEAVTLTAQVLPNGAEDTITWSSSDASVAAVDNGTVTPIGAGECEIYASITNGAAAVSYVTVTDSSQLNVTLDLTTDDSYSLLSTDTTYTDGVYSDTVDGLAVTYYQEGIAYSNGQQYGTKAVDGKKIIGFTADRTADYNVSVPYTNGTGTINLYTSDGTLVTSAAASTYPGTANLIYSHSDESATDVYITVTDPNNIHIPRFVITTSTLTVSEEVTAKGSVSGYEDDEDLSSLKLTFTPTSGTAVQSSVSDYVNSGVELVSGTEYTVTAAGSGVYKGGTVTLSESSDSVGIELSRIKFDFPIDLSNNFDDLSLLISNFTYSSGSYTEPYSGITVYQNGMIPNSSQYGAKTNNYEILSFTADVAGTYTVTFTPTTTGDSIQLNVNGTADESTTTSLTAGTKATMTVTAEEGDTIMLYTPTRSNLYYSYIDVNGPTVVEMDFTSSTAFDNSFIFENETTGKENERYGTVTDKTTGLTLIVDAINGEGKFDLREDDGDVQMNKDTIVLVPVFEAGDVITIEVHNDGNTNYANFTIGGTEFADKSITTTTYTYTATEDDVNAGYAAIVGTDTSYIKSITLKTSADDVTATKGAEDASFSFETANPSAATDSNIYIIGKVLQSEVESKGIKSVGFSLGVTVDAAVRGTADGYDAAENITSSAFYKGVLDENGTVVIGDNDGEDYYYVAFVVDSTVFDDADVSNNTIYGAAYYVDSSGNVIFDGKTIRAITKTE